MTESLSHLGARYNAWERADKNDFQRRARILQSMWREEQGYPIGDHRGRPLGSRLEMPWARDTLSNFLTGTTRAVVRAEVIEGKDSGKLFGQPRIFNDLLSSQPLCFNLFAELKLDLPRASSVFKGLTAGRVGEVTRLEFEHSPGRGDDRYTGDRSAFDAYVEYLTPAGSAGFIGIEVKYHENRALRRPVVGRSDHVEEPLLKVSASPHRDRYDELANTMGCFRAEASSRLKAQPLQQIWRDHLLSGSLLAAQPFDDGFFVFLYPAQNLACADAVGAYQECLSDDATFVPWTLETVVAGLREHCPPSWVDAVDSRYLDFSKLDAAAGGVSGS